MRMVLFVVLLFSVLLVASTTATTPRSGPVTDVTFTFALCYGDPAAPVTAAYVFVQGNDSNIAVCGQYHRYLQHFSKRTH